MKCFIETICNENLDETKVNNIAKFLSGTAIDFPVLPIKGQALEICLYGKKYKGVIVDTCPICEVCAMGTATVHYRIKFKPEEIC